MPLLLKKERDIGKLEYISSKEIADEMAALRKHFGVTESKADIQATRKILSKTTSITDELSAMRDDNR